MKSFIKKNSAFTLVEILVVIGVLILIFSISFPYFGRFRRDFELNDTTEKIISVLRLARSKTLGSLEASQYGVYFGEDRYVLFKGSSFQEENIHESYDLPRGLEFEETDEKEVLFEKINGTVLDPGSISLTDTKEKKTIYIHGSGEIGKTKPSLVSDENRIKDSRHVHINYDRGINVSSESLIFDFNGEIREIPIKNNIKDNQINWEGEFDIEGEVQILEIKTYELNNPNTLFSIIRDRRFNTKSLKISLSEDFSGTLCEYSSDGLITKNNSIYASEPQWR